MLMAGKEVNQEVNAPENELLTRDEVMSLLKISRASLYKFMEADGFPKPIKLGKTNRWLKGEVSEWLTARPRAQIQVTRA